MWLKILKNLISRKEAIRFYKSKTQTLKTLTDENPGSQIDVERSADQAPSHEEQNTLFSGKEKMNRVFGKSLKIRQVDSGSCNACEWECTALTNPIYDIQRFGIDFVASPRHADVLLVTGPVSRQMELALKKTHLAMPRPKIVIACGDCAIDGGIFRGSYAVKDGVSNAIPVNFQIPGCPPSPTVITEKLLKLMERI
ncbi:MAG: NADH-quinone oxidoreductase subunit B family protein [Candidatus Scalindua sp.]|nr:NADH-quinone oxidoreductase subunit B family protein [Candidatus Scalindua sp.]MCR4344095.1 NADH-quinone oxidoreductase subunit B family protein [Candidatus Scalindua sp.]